MPLVLTTGRRVALAAIPLVALAALTAGRAVPPCAPDNGGLSLPDGFCASVVASAVDDVRHLAVAPGGDLYAATGGGLLHGGVAAFRDRDGDGTMDERASFGPRGGNDVARARRISLPRARGTHRAVASHSGEARARRRPGDDRRRAPGGRRPRGQDDRLSRRRRAAREDRLRDQQLPAVEPRRKIARPRSVHRARAPRRDLAVRGRPGRPAVRDGHRWATGLRNAEALGVQPGTGAVWAAIHGRDQLGAELGLQRRGQREQSRRGAGAGVGGR